MSACHLTETPRSRVETLLFRLTRPLFHHPEIMLGVLVPVLSLDSVACRCRFARQGEVSLVVPARVYGRPVLPLLPGDIRAVGRLPASL